MGRTIAVMAAAVVLCMALMVGAQAARVLIFDIIFEKFLFYFLTLSVPLLPQLLEDPFHPFSTGPFRQIKIRRNFAVRLPLHKNPPDKQKLLVSQENWDDAKEITQEAFLTALVKIDQFYASENHLGWIKAVIRKKAQNFNKVKRGRAAVTTFLDDPSLSLSAPDHYGGIDAPSAQAVRNASCVISFASSQFFRKRYANPTSV